MQSDENGDIISNDKTNDTRGDIFDGKVATDDSVEGIRKRHFKKKDDFQRSTPGTAEAFAQRTHRDSIEGS
ncbi:MAG: hypothetical protein IKD04_02365 [Clostridia bacterium]|nr:hypothetical protein [Clostridia bacterium]